MTSAARRLRDPLGNPVSEWVAHRTVCEAQALLNLRRPTLTGRQAPRLALARGEPPPRVVLGFGLGLDSSAILARWLTDPSSRDFELHELAVITAMTGQEWPETRRLVEKHLLPLMAAAGVRYIQVARRGSVEADGVDVLSDSRSTKQLHLVGAWTLAHEMFDAGTVPQTTGGRHCSQHFKGFPLDAVIAVLTCGQPYRHVMGFELGERSRAKRDAEYNTALRSGEYPLRDWDGGWDRERAQAFLFETFGVKIWVKSACTYCPFALGSEAGRLEAIARFIAEPEAGVLALVMEFVATALNATQGLIKGKRLLTLLHGAAGTGEVLAGFERLLADLPWAVYHVRRTLSPRDDGKANHARSLRILDVGSPEEMRARLGERAKRGGVPVTIGDPAFPDDTHPRVWLRRRELTVLAKRIPTAEEFLTIAPATAISKTGPAFTGAWDTASQFYLPI